MKKERTMSKAKRTAGYRISTDILRLAPAGYDNEAKYIAWEKWVADRIDAAIARNGHKMYDMGREDQRAAVKARDADTKRQTVGWVNYMPTDPDEPFDAVKETSSECLGTVSANGILCRVVMVMNPPTPKAAPGKVKPVTLPPTWGTITTPKAAHQTGKVRARTNIKGAK